MAFSRGLHTGWLGGVNNQRLVHARFGKKRGVFLGEVAGVQNERVALTLRGPLQPGDGVVFDAGHPEAPEQGGRVYRLETRGPQTLLSFGRGDVDFRRLHAGDKVWKTSDPRLERRLRQSFEGNQPQFQRPVRFEVHGRAGQPLTLIAADELGHVVRLDSALPLAKAETQPLTAERLRQLLGRLGGTPFCWGKLTNALAGDVMLPWSELNRLRREAVAELEKLRVQPRRWRLCRPAEATVPAASADVAPAEPAISPALTEAARRDTRTTGPEARSPELIVLVRQLAQLEAALRCGVTTLYCDFEDLKKYREAVQQVHCSGGPAQAARPPQVFLAPPRIFKPGEQWTLQQVRACGADGYLVRNSDHLAFFAADRRIGDYSLNVANRLSADYFRNHYGLERVTASYDLNCSELEALLRAAPPEWFEVTIHQHIPMFHMEHCVFCAFLSTGTDYTNCGRPCDRHDVKLRDRVGAEHPVKADAGCRNTVFNARAQTGAEYVTRLRALGVRHFRIEFLNETPEQVAQTIVKYRQLLRGDITGPQLWKELRLQNQLGVTRGSMAGTRP